MQFLFGRNIKTYTSNHKGVISEYIWRNFRGSEGRGVPPPLSNEAQRSGTSSLFPFPLCSPLGSPSTRRQPLPRHLLPTHNTSSGLTVVPPPKNSRFSTILGSLPVNSHVHPNPPNHLIPSTLFDSGKKNRFIIWRHFRTVSKKIKLFRCKWVKARHDGPKKYLPRSFCRLLWEGLNGLPEEWWKGGWMLARFVTTRGIVDGGTPVVVVRDTSNRTDARCAARWWRGSEVSYLLYIAGIKLTGGEKSQMSPVLSACSTTVFYVVGSFQFSAHFCGPFWSQIKDAACSHSAVSLWFGSMLQILLELTLSYPSKAPRKQLRAGLRKHPNPNSFPTNCRLGH